ncbi:MAG: TetR/AcrR family transcriptional regulator C-terminal domain-containing protein [Acidimicrobiia bacterium]|nr:TetR/AcrR family transcriptional regulator C-terminal domain-containing protein [Acidimicrobiia bacterium]
MRVNRARVLDTALRIVNERGADGLTMRALATELDIEAPSLYKHVKSKDEILDGICELVYGQVTVDELPDEWHERMKVYARAFRTALLDNRNAVCILSTRPVATERSMLLVEISLIEFVRGGVDAETGRQLLNIIVSFIIGHVLAEAGSAQPGSEDQAKLDELYASLDPADFQHSLATVAGPKADRDAEFELAMDLLIEGIAIRFSDQLALAKAKASAVAHLTTS